MHAADPVPQKELTQDTQGKTYGLVQPARFAYGRDAQLHKLPAAYYIAQDCVTRADFLRFVEETGYDYPAAAIAKMDIMSPEDTCPASPISWLDAKAYVRWMRKITGQYYSLPSDKEWEYAVRGQFGKPYPWGTIQPTHDLAVFSTENLPCYRTKPAGGRPESESPFGCQDAVGNVWEWTLDSYDDENLVHGLRGGSCMDGADACRCTSRRYEIDNTARIPYAGFRMTWLPPNMLETYRAAVAGAAYEERTIVTETNHQLDVSQIPGSPAMKNHR